MSPPFRWQTGAVRWYCWPKEHFWHSLHWLDLFFFAEKRNLLTSELWLQTRTVGRQWRTGGYFAKRFDAHRTWGSAWDTIHTPLWPQKSVFWDHPYGWQTEAVQMCWRRPKQYIHWHEMVLEEATQSFEKWLFFFWPSIWDNCLSINFNCFSRDLTINWMIEKFFNNQIEERENRLSKWVAYELTLVFDFDYCLFIWPKRLINSFSDKNVE